jgi:endonuclease/exonuclease/phosphatase family metal-dependent hydrolase
VDQNESLVTIHYHPGGETALAGTQQDILANDQVHCTQCPTDLGKGALSVTSTSGLQIVNTHVPFNSRAASSLLAGIPWPDRDRAFVLVGDMNRRANDLMQMINRVHPDKATSSLLSSVTTDKPTRTGLDRDGHRQNSWIDYFVISDSLKSASNSPVVVYDEVGDVSDHYPILLHFKDA